jgi:signal transduction histidine kinase
VDLKVSSGAAEIKISDSGCGMSAEFINERLFKPFDTTKGNAGMGIGVYDVRQFAQSYGGNLTVQSEPGEGSCFTLCLPIHS